MFKRFDDSRILPFIVTNKHVVEGATNLILNFIACKDGTNEPALGTVEDYTINDPAAAWVGHPDEDVDVAVLPAAGILDAIHDRICIRAIPTTQMPSEGDGIYIDVVEEITFIGYPNGHRDPAHLTPIVRRGISATPIELPFGGKPAFLVDGSVFAGSSGSPVFLLNEGFYRAGPSEVAAGNRLVLVGVVAATVLRETLLPVVVGHGPHVRLAQELNLGVVYNWHAIEQTLALLVPRA